MSSWRGRRPCHGARLPSPSVRRDPVDPLQHRRDLWPTLELLEGPGYRRRQLGRSGPVPGTFCGSGSSKRSPSDDIMMAARLGGKSIQRRLERRSRILALRVGLKPALRERRGHASRDASPADLQDLAPPVDRRSGRAPGGAGRRRPARNLPTSACRGYSVQPRTRLAVQGGPRRSPLAGRRTFAGAHGRASRAARSPGPSRGPRRPRSRLVSLAAIDRSAYHSVGPIADVDAVLRRGAARDPIEAMQADHVVDPRDRGVAEQRAEHLVVVAVAGLPRALRVRRGSPPVLALRPERVRWSAGGDVRRE